jgi:hypothetical protein
LELQRRRPALFAVFLGKPLAARVETREPR